MLPNLGGLGDHIYVTLPTDENGLTSRQCPNTDCKGVFKVKFGTGLKGKNLPCHCPYCGQATNMSEFNTPEQIEYAKSIAIDKLMGALERDMKAWGREIERKTRNSFIKMKVDFKREARPIRYYREKEIETHVTCEACALEYAIFGVFGFCPDCGTHNSLQILFKNLELVEKEVVFAASTQDADLEMKLIEDALENSVSAFDGFGRAATQAASSKLPEPSQWKQISFQNIESARKRVKADFAADISEGIEPDDWDFINRCFQKRHLLAHKMGVIDEEYIKKARDKKAIAGRKVTISSDEVLKLAALLRAIGKNLRDRLSD